MRAYRPHRRLSYRPGRNAGADTMTIDGVTAVIVYDPDINQFRGKFLGLNGGADFYADDITGLKREGALSLKVFREACAEG